LVQLVGHVMWMWSIEGVPDVTRVCNKRSAR